MSIYCVWLFYKVSESWIRLHFHSWRFWQSQCNPLVTHWNGPITPWSLNFPVLPLPQTISWYHYYFVKSFWKVDSIKIDSLRDCRSTERNRKYVWKRNYKQVRMITGGPLKKKEMLRDQNDKQVRMTLGEPLKKKEMFRD